MYFRSSMPPPYRFRYAHKGFTLIEVIVALAITSLIMTLLMGATFYVMQIRVKLTEEVRTGEQQARKELWFEQIVASILPVPTEDPGTFKATETQFSTWLSRPLNANILATPTEATLQLQKNIDISGIDLIYSTEKDKFILKSWPEASAHFAYFDNSGKKLTAWSPLQQASERIPRAIQVEVLSSKDNSIMDFWFAKIEAAPYLEQKSIPSFLTGKSQ